MKKVVCCISGTALTPSLLDDIVGGSPSVNQCLANMGMMNLCTDIRNEDIAGIPYL